VSAVRPCHPEPSSGCLPNFAAHYAGGGWLVCGLARASMAISETRTSFLQCLKFLQNRARPACRRKDAPGPARRGSNNLAGREHPVLWAIRPLSRCPMFTSRFPGPLMSMLVCSIGRNTHCQQDPINAAGLPDLLRVAVPERAVLELRVRGRRKPKPRRSTQSLRWLRSPQGVARHSVMLHQCESRAPVLHLGARDGWWMVDALLEQYPVPHRQRRATGWPDSMT